MSLSLGKNPTFSWFRLHAKDSFSCLVRFGDFDVDIACVCCVCLSRLLEQCTFWLAEVLIEGRKAKIEVAQASTCWKWGGSE